MNKVLKILFIILVSHSFNLNGQTLNWIKPDTILNGSVQAMYHDTTDNSIYVGGTFSRIDTDTIIGIARYQNGHWYRMGDGVDWNKNFPWNPNINQPDPVKSIIKYRDTIYITGQFTHTNGKILNGIAKWNGTTWQPLGSGLKFTNSGSGAKFKIFNNELYLVGAFDSIAGIGAHSLAKYDGTSWQAVHNLPRISNNPGGANLIQDLEFYNNELYLTGVLFNNSTIFSTVKWNGSNWVNPGFGVYGNSNTLGMFTFKNELYIVGIWSHYDNPNNIGNCIAKFNGTSWQEAGSGMFYYPNYLARVRSYAVNSNYLFVGGGFTTCNNNRSIKYVARFDGTNWCSVDTTFNNATDIIALNFMNDTLYMGGYLGSQFNTSGWAYCKNTDHTDTCNLTFVSINELEKLNRINIYPNPSSSILTIGDEQNQFQNSTISIKNTLGQTVLFFPFKSQIDVSSLPTGVYFFQIKTEDKKLLNTKFIKN